jgi:hypothetical protein
MKTAPRIAVNTGRESAAAFALCVSMLVSVPLAFSTSVYRIFSLPKFAILLTVSAALAPLTAAAALRSRGEAARVFRSRHVAIVCLYFVSMTVSTILGVAPLASLFGSFYNQMGLMTHSCFIVCFFGLVFGVGESEARLLAALRAMALTGFLVAAYALIQISGHDPFLQPDSYWFRTESGPIMRVIGTLGHADYLGNFLLYTTPVTAGLGAGSRGRARWLALVATALSAVAITCSGTRGAWAGFLVGRVRSPRNARRSGRVAPNAPRANPQRISRVRRGPDSGLGRELEPYAQERGRARSLVVRGRRDRGGAHAFVARFDQDDTGVCAHWGRA